MRTGRSLMLVSAWVDERLRCEVDAGIRPRPEYLVLESAFGLDLLDWSRVPGARRQRTGWQSAVHAAAAVRRLRDYDAVFSDGEHVGIPLAMAMRSVGSKTPHLVIGHRLSTPAKTRLMRELGAQRGMSRIVVHSPAQHTHALRRLGVPAHKLALTPYYADAEFWRPQEVGEEPLIVSAGREHRDYATLASAAAELDMKVFVASGSIHSPGATVSLPSEWPANFGWGFADYVRLRELYSRAQIVVVPVVKTDFQAGVTTVLEAMAMGKPVITTNAAEQGGVLRDGITGISVPPGDVAEMRSAIRYLMSNPGERARLGRGAREAVLASYDVDAYSSRLAEHLSELRNLRVAA
jgi:glycosyltransferase involved in cell wall biosynthesis